MTRARIPAAFTVAVLVHVAFDAAAQETTPPLPPAVPFESEREETRTRLQTAQALFERQNFDAALAEFERVYELLSGRPARPRVLFNIAQCHEQLGRYDQAVANYRRYLDEMGERATNRAEVTATLRTLEGLLATLQIESNVAGAEVYVDDRRVGVAPGVVCVAGGRHVVPVPHPGPLPAQQEVQVAGRATRSLRFALERIPVSRGLRPVYFWTAWGGTAAVLLAAGVTGGVALAQDAGARAQLSDPTRRFAVTEATRDDIRGTALAADVLYGTAAAVAVGAAVLYVLTDFRGASADRSPPRVAVLPWRDGVNTGVALGGSF
jgi:tetratricopeptide (TPR) repeat protein